MLIKLRPISETTTQLSVLPSGSAGIRTTLRAMVKIVETEKSNINNRELALSLVKNLPAKCWVCEAKAVLDFVHNSIRYVRDIDGVETIATPTKTLEYGQGDCDDMAILAATLLKTLGHPTRFVAVGFNGRALSHVLVETLIGSRWTPLELTEKLGFGVYPPNITRRMVYKI